MAARPIPSWYPGGEREREKEMDDLLIDSNHFAIDLLKEKENVLMDRFFFVERYFIFVCGNVPPWLDYVTIVQIMTQDIQRGLFENDWCLLVKLLEIFAIRKKKKEKKFLSIDLVLFTCSQSKRWKERRQHLIRHTQKEEWKVLRRLIRISKAVRKRVKPHKKKRIDIRWCFHRAIMIVSFCFSFSSLPLSKWNRKKKKICLDQISR